jgi:hypothetical protein
MTKTQRNGLIVTTLLVTISSAYLAHLFINGTREKEFVSPDRKSRLVAYHLLSLKDFMPTMPGNGSWRHYAFRLEIDGIGEVRRSKATCINIHQDPPRWDSDSVSFHGPQDIELWDTKPESYR